MTEKSKSELVSATEDAPSGRLSTASSQAPVTTAGRELDELVAEKVMGWRRNGQAWMDYRGRLRTIEPTSFGSFQPSTDIGAALEVLQSEMATPGFRVLINCSGAGTYDVEWSFADEDVPDGSGWWCVAEETDIETLPLAICLAAMQAVGA